MLKVLIYKRYGYEEMFQRLKRHLERESARTGKKVSQKEFVLALVRQALDEAERKEAANNGTNLE